MQVYAQPLALTTSLPVSVLVVEVIPATTSSLVAVLVPTINPASVTFLLVAQLVSATLLVATISSLVVMLDSATPLHQTTYF